MKKEQRKEVNHKNAIKRPALPPQPQLDGC